jgi:hypothetical protein
LPDLDQLDQDSDYSAFLAPGVDAELRRRALRKLFCSPKFNTFDGLDTYRDDFTSFPALGDVVTADMRHHLERLAKRLVEESAPPAVDPPRPTKPSRESAQTASAMAREPVESASPTRPVPGPHEDDESRDTA